MAEIKEGMEWVSNEKNILEKPTSSMNKSEKVEKRYWRKLITLLVSFFQNHIQSHDFPGSQIDQRLVDFVIPTIDLMKKTFKIMHLS